MSSDSKPVGTSIIFINRKREVLLFLRDNNPEIECPGRWDVLGGHLEAGETPLECIVREMKEELGISITDPDLFEINEFPDRVEYTFWQRADFSLDDINLTEGQKVAWFSEDRVKETHVAFGFNRILDSFFTKAPFLETSYDRNPQI